MLMLRKHFQDKLVGPRDIRCFARQRCPPKWSLAFAKQGPDVRRRKSREVVRVFHALLKRKRSNVVAVIERHGTQLLQRQHSSYMPGRRCPRSLLIFGAIFLPQLE